MNLKAACKTAIILSIVSFILIVFGQLFGALTAFFKSTAAHNGWSSTPNASNIAFFFMRLQISFFYLLAPGLGTAAFIILLSGFIKQQHNPQANVNKRHIAAAILFGIVTLFMTWRTIGLIWLTIEHTNHLSFQQVLSFLWSLTATLSVITLCIFAAASTKKIFAQKLALFSTVFHILLIIVTLAGAGNTLHHFITSDYYQNAGEIPTVLWIASFICGRGGLLLSKAAILLFLLAWLIQKPQPPEAGVIDSSPEPIPTLSAETLPERE